MMLSVGFCLLICFALGSTYYVPPYQDGEERAAPAYDTPPQAFNPLKDGSVWNYLAHPKSRRQQQQHPVQDTDASHFYDEMRLQEKRARLLG